MSTVFIRHEVSDFDAWHPGFVEHGSVRREHGLTDTALYRSTDNPNEVTIVLAAEDAGRAQDFLSSADLRETMQKVGVVGAPSVWIADEA